MKNANLSKKYICQIGPGKGYPGGMKTVIDKYISSEELSEYKQKRIVTASKKHKIISFITGTMLLVYFCVRKQVVLAHIHMSERGSCVRTEILVMICRLFKVKILIHSHGGEIEPYYYSLTSFQKKRFKSAMDKAEYIIVLTKGHVSFWENIVSEDKIYILPNCVSCPVEMEKSYFAGGKLNILFLGLVSEGKGIYELIEAIKFLDEEGYSDIMLRIGGNGDVEKASRIAKETGIDDRIRFLGWMGESEKNLLFAESDILVLPSHFESFGIVIIEAMAHKLAVICGDKGYSKEIVSDGIDGLLVESGNSRDLADKIKYFFNNYNISDFGNNGYKKVANNYSNQIVLNRLKMLYQTILGF